MESILELENVIKFADNDNHPPLIRQALQDLEKPRKKRKKKKPGKK